MTGRNPLSAKHVKQPMIGHHLLEIPELLGPVSPNQFIDFNFPRFLRSSVRKGDHKPMRRTVDGYRCSDTGPGVRRESGAGNAL